MLAKNQEETSPKNDNLDKNDEEEETEEVNEMNETIVSSVADSVENNAFKLSDSTIEPAAETTAEKAPADQTATQPSNETVPKSTNEEVDITINETTDETANKTANEVVNETTNLDSITTKSEGHSSAENARPNYYINQAYVDSQLSLIKKLQLEQKLNSIRSKRKMSKQREQLPVSIGESPGVLVRSVRKLSTNVISTPADSYLSNSLDAPSIVFEPQEYSYPDIAFSKPSNPQKVSKHSIKKGKILVNILGGFITVLFVLSIALIIFASIKPCLLTSCHKNASLCVNRFPFWAQCICDAGLAGNGKSHCVPCGQTMQTTNLMRIVGGREAPKSSWPFAVFISQHYKGKFLIQNAVYTITYRWSCGGTIVNHRTILTAAHCIHDDFFEYTDENNKVHILKIHWNEWYPNLESTFSIYVGAHDLRDLSTALKVRVKKVTKHHDFEEQTLKNDIASIQLLDSITTSFSAQFACLPYVPSNSYPEPMENPAFIVGWGRTSMNGSSSNRLKNSKINIYSPSECLFVEPRVLKNWNSQICAGVLDGSTDTCQGDSGGGLYSQKNFNTSEARDDRFVLSGIVSYGDGCAKVGKPGIYTRTSFHLDWIRKNSDF